MTTETISFAGADANPYTAPAGWTIYDSFRRYGYVSPSGGVMGNPFGQMVFNTYASGVRTITADITQFPADATDEWGFCFINSSRTGFSLVVTNTTTKLRKEVAGTGGATIATVAATNTANATFSVEYNDVSGSIVVRKNGSTVLTGNYLDTPNLLAGIQSYRVGAASQAFTSVSIDYTINLQSVTSINGGNPLTASQIASSAVTNGFTGTGSMSSITATWGAYSVPITSIGGTTNAPTFVKGVRVDGQVYPKNGQSLTMTFINGAESASSSHLFNKDADDVEIVVASPVLDDDAYLFSAIKTATGRTAVDGDIGYYKVPPEMSDLTVGADGRIRTTNAGSFDLWVYTAATAVNYFYRVTVGSGGSVSVEVGLTSSGLTSSGLTSSCLTSSGL